MCIISDKVLKIDDNNTKILVMMGQVSTRYTGPDLLFQPFCSVITVYNIYPCT